MSNIQGKFDSLIGNWLSTYSNTKQPIEISFRKLAPELNKGDRFTHLIHSYPAKLLMHIPYIFLNNNILSKKGDLVLDPFCGSGTVLLESIIAGRNAVGSDSNPLARLISTVKTQRYNSDKLYSRLNNIVNNLNNIVELSKPRVPNIDYWFLPDTQRQLQVLLTSINAMEDGIYKDFFLVCFSNCVKKVSLADQKVSVPVKLNSNRYPANHPLHKKTKEHLEDLKKIKVIDKFKEIAENNIGRIISLGNSLLQENNASIISNDARKLTKSLKSDTLLENESVDLIISSPPYAGAQKYIRASGLSLGWLNYLPNENSLKDLDDNNIGRENYKKSDYLNLSPTGVSEADELLEDIRKTNILRAHIAGNYLIEMREAFKETIRTLKPGGYFILVVGNNQVCGMEFRTQEYLKEIVEGLGLKLILQLIDDIRSYGLMTKRNKTANIITREWVLVFKK